MFIITCEETPPRFRESSQCLVFYHLELLSKVRGHSLGATFFYKSDLEDFPFPGAGWMCVCFCWGDDGMTLSWMVLTEIVEGNSGSFLPVIPSSQSLSCLGGIAGSEVSDLAYNLKELILAVVGFS